MPIVVAEIGMTVIRVPVIAVVIHMQVVRRPADRKGSGHTPEKPRIEMATRWVRVVVDRVSVRVVVIDRSG